jgi:hypothetical protein
VWCDGEISGHRLRQSLDTRDWGRAGRKAAALEADLESGRARKRLADAASAFLSQCSTEASTFKKYSRWLDALTTFAAAAGVEHIGAIHLEFLDSCRQSRDVCA